MSKSRVPPYADYGGQDTYNSRINFLRIRTSNNNPKTIGRFNLDYPYESRGRSILSHKHRIIGYPRVWPNFGVVKMMNSTVYIVNGCGLLPCFLPYQPVCFTIIGHISKFVHHVRLS